MYVNAACGVLLSSAVKDMILRDLRNRIPSRYGAAHTSVHIRTQDVDRLDKVPLGKIIMTDVLKIPDVLDNVGHPFLRGLTTSNSSNSPSSLPAGEVIIGVPISNLISFHRRPEFKRFLLQQPDAQIHLWTSESDRVPRLFFGTRVGRSSANGIRYVSGIKGVYPELSSITHTGDIPRSYHDGFRTTDPYREWLEQVRIGARCPVPFPASFTSYVVPPSGMIDGSEGYGDILVGQEANSFFHSMYTPEYKALLAAWTPSAVTWCE
jgi:hypothetical protein